MGLVQEFKEFALKGSVIDLAVGVVIGGAFSGIVKSLVDNIIMPPINLLTARSGVNFKEAALTIETKSPKLDDAGKIIEGEGAGLVVQDYPILNYGPFTQTIFEFLLIALALFVAIKLINAARSRMEDEPEEEEVAKPSEDIQLLREIRDALQKS